MNQKFCTYCGAENEAGAEKCVSCNAEFVDEDTAESAADVKESDPTLSKNYVHTEDLENANPQPSNNDAPFTEPQATEGPIYAEPVVPPCYPDPTTDYEYYDSTPKPKKSGPSVLAKIATVFLCIILFISVTATAALYAVGRVADEDNIRNWVDEIDLYETAELIYGEPFMDDDADYTLTFGKYRVTGISVKSVKKLVNSTEAGDFAAEKLIEYITGIKTGSYEGSISENDIVDLLADLEKRISKTFGYAPNKEDRKEIKKILKDMDLEVYDLSEIKKDFPVPFTVAGIVLSDYVFYGAIAFDVLLMAVIILINRKRISGGIKAIGITFIPNGIILTGAFAASKLIPELLERDVREFFDIFYPLADNAVKSILFVGIGLIAVGILTLVVVAIARSICKKIKSKKAAVTEGYRY